MLQIKDTLVSLDLAEEFFCCDLDQCLGACCIEGDAGAPLEINELERLEEVLPEIEGDLLPRAVDEIRESGVAYTDEEGDLVTTIIDGRNCAFSCYAEGGKCLCAIDKAYREGRVKWRKPISCYLYPLRLTNYPTFTAVKYHRWKICRPAVANGRRLGIRLYQAMKEPLIERFGREWYEELCEACEAWNEQQKSGRK
ncbi:MAG: DUF3109 family protein [Paramuribaculum sp.]|nr:DUF3109 family protein [Paramuribaculum sp.]